MALILTLDLDGRSFERLDAWRGRWFPWRGYRLPAHLTLFHKLPDADEAPIVAFLGDLAPRLDALPIRFDGILRFAAGTAIGARSPGVDALRSAMAAHWRDGLSRQDRSFRPHVTVQNKVPPETAERDRMDIAATFAPWTGYGTGFALWHYRGGPWELAWESRFGGIE